MMKIRFDEDHTFLLRKFREPMFDPTTSMTNDELRQALGVRHARLGDLPVQNGPSRLKRADFVKFNQVKQSPLAFLRYYLVQFRRQQGKVSDRHV